MARDDIEVEQLTIGEIFSERFAFKVPTYQRTYAWTTEHAAALLEDLLESLGDPDAAFKRCCRYSGRYDDSLRAHYFQGLTGPDGWT